MKSSSWEKSDGVKSTDQRSSKLPHLQLSSPWVRKMLDKCFFMVKKPRRIEIPSYSVFQTWSHFCWECRWSVVWVRQMGCLGMQSLWLEEELGSLCRWREATWYALGFRVKPVLCSFFFFFFLIYLAEQDLHWRFSVFIVAFRIFSCGTWDLVLWPGIKPHKLL